MIEQISSDLSNNVASRTDEILRAAILEKTGARELILEDVARLGVRKIYADGREVVSYDGADLVCFWPPTFEHGRGDDFYKITVTRKYQLLAQ